MALANPPAPWTGREGVFEAMFAFDTHDLIWFRDDWINSKSALT